MYNDPKLVARCERLKKEVTRWKKRAMKAERLNLDNAIELVNLETENEEMKAFILEGTCPEAYGFEGRETFPDCGKCVHCKLKKEKKNETET